MSAPHPARWSSSLLPTIEEWLAGRERVIDPFAGVCRGLRLGGLVCHELEWEWVSQCPRPSVQGNALHLPFRDGAFDGLVTSVTFGNRMADHHNARDGSERNTYRHKLGRELHPDNSGAMQFGREYKDFHRACVREWRRVLEVGGVGILNIQDHIRRGVKVNVTGWWVRCLRDEGFKDLSGRTFYADGNRQGENGKVRVGYQHLIRFGR